MVADPALVPVPQRADALGARHSPRPAARGRAAPLAPGPAARRAARPPPGSRSPAWAGGPPSAGTRPSRCRFSRYLEMRPRYLRSGGTVAANSMTLWSRSGARTSSERGHAHPVDLDEDVVGEPGLEVHVEQLAQRVETARPARSAGAKPAKGSCAGQRAPQSSGDEQPALRRRPERGTGRRSTRARTWCRGSARSSGPGAGGAASRPWDRCGRAGRAGPAGPSRAGAAQAALPAVQPVAALIAGEDLVAAVAGQRDRHPLAGRPARRSTWAGPRSRRRARRGARPAAAGPRPPRGSTITSWWSVPSASATARAWGSSLNLRSAKPTLVVHHGARRTGGTSPPPPPSSPRLPTGRRPAARR